MAAVNLLEDNVRKFVGRHVDVLLHNGRYMNGQLSSFDPDLMAVTLSLEEGGVLTSHTFPISMARVVQTR